MFTVLARLAQGSEQITVLERTSNIDQSKHGFDLRARIPARESSAHRSEILPRA